MKKATLLLLGAALATGSVQAQSIRQRSVVAIGGETKAIAQTKKIPFVSEAAAPHASRNIFAKGAATPFYTQTFSGGIPAGWSQTAGPGTLNGWRWANAAPTGALNTFNIGVINSTTASNGWLLYNSDSIGSINNNLTPFGGSITSAPISCTGHANVVLNFQQWFRRFKDTCYVDVSNNNTTWTSFPVFPNDAIGNNTNLPTNPSTANIVISAVAGNQPNVYIRFRYVCAQPGGSFNWLIDDVTLADANAVDLGIGKSGVIMAATSTSSFTDFASFSSIPLQLVDTLFPITLINNFGSTNATTATVTATIYNGTTQVYTNTNTVTNVAVNGVDSIAFFSTAPYKPTARGNYTAVFTLNQAGDTVLGNNRDTVRFAITDTTYAPYGNNLTGFANYIKRPAANGNPELTRYYGSRFTIPNNVTDTITSISVAFSSTTSVGIPVECQLYKAVTTNGTDFSWSSIARSAVKTLTANDLSTSGGVVLTYFPLVAVGAALTNLKLSGGDYAAVVTPVGATSSQTALVLLASAPFGGAPTAIGYQGQSDTSLNSNTYSFGAAGNIATGQIDVPVVRANFATYKPTAIRDIPGVSVGAAFPNPANTTINIPVTVKESTEVSITISNVMGQVIRTHNMGTIGAGNMNIAAINTSDLANGVYIYTINANGGRSAGRIVVRH